MTPEGARLRLLGAGFCPTPCLGKKAILNGWTKNHEPTAFEIEQWTRAAPAATNTGILTRTTPAFDIDVLDPDAAAAIEQLVRDRFEERGDILVRVGFAPKRCILFRTDTPFRKIEVNFVVAPGAKGEKLEFLGDGQQFVAFGIHPDTGRPYSWSDREPGELKREDLPYVHEEEARALVADATELLIRDFGYRPAAGAKKAAANHSPSFAPRKTAAAGETTAYGQAALDRTCDEIRNAGPGQRDAAIGGNVLAIGSLIGGGEIDEGEALDQLLAAAEVNGGDFNEQRDKITRAVATGKKNPKGAPDDTLQEEPTSEAGPDTPQDGATPEAKAFQAAATLKAKGMSYDDVRDALIGHDDPDIVAWAHEEGLADDEKGLHNAYDGKKSAGGVGGGAGPKASAEAYPLIWHGENTNEPFVNWGVEEMLYRTGVAMFSGQWGTYKTFIVIDLAVSIMTKTPFAGRAVRRQGGVLFIAAEGQAQIRVRIQGAAIGKVANIEPDDGVVKIDPVKMPFTWVKRSPRLADPKAFVELRATIEAAKKGMQERFDLPLALVIIDALMPAAQFKDANDATETRRVMDMLAAVGHDLDVLVVVVDHFGKDVSTGTRNSSAKEDAADSILALLGDRSIEGKLSNPRMALRKVKGAETGIEFPFEPCEVFIEEPCLDLPIRTFVINWRLSDQGDDAQPKKEKPWSKSLRTFKRALDGMLLDHGKRLRPFPDGPEVLAVEFGIVKAEFLKAYPADNPETKSRMFDRAIKQAVQENLAYTREIGGTVVIWT